VGFIRWLLAHPEVSVQDLPQAESADGDELRAYLAARQGKQRHTCDGRQEASARRLTPVSMARVGEAADRMPDRLVTGDDT
jgi:hypothetical protein